MRPLQAHPSTVRPVSAHPVTVSADVIERGWAEYDRTGCLRLGRVLDDEQVDVLRRRADELAAGRCTLPGVQFQLDRGGSYDELAELTGHLPAGTTAYRKVQGLECDPAFADLLHHPLIIEVCRRVYGRHASLSTFRAMIMNKPAELGTVLPWHQDGGDVWKLDRDPLVTAWVALDDATTENGCVEVVPGSHHLGLLSPHGSTLEPHHVAEHCPEAAVVPLEVPAGHAVIMHNWLIHRSGTNPTGGPRRAFTACYADGRTTSTLVGTHFPMLEGAPPPAPAAFLAELHRREREHLRSIETAAEYALSLREENRALRASFAEAERYALSLADELAKHVSN